MSLETSGTSHTPTAQAGIKRFLDADDDAGDKKRAKRSPEDVDDSAAAKKPTAKRAAEDVATKKPTAKLDTVVAARVRNEKATWIPLLRYLLDFRDCDTDVLARHFDVAGDTVKLLVGYVRSFLSTERQNVRKILKNHTIHGVVEAMMAQFCSTSLPTDARNRFRNKVTSMTVYLQKKGLFESIDTDPNYVISIVWPDVWDCYAAEIGDPPMDARERIRYQPSKKQTTSASEDQGLSPTSQTSSSSLSSSLSVSVSPPPAASATALMSPVAEPTTLPVAPPSRPPPPVFRPATKCLPNLPNVRRCDTSDEPNMDDDDDDDSASDDGDGDANDEGSGEDGDANGATLTLYARPNHAPWPRTETPQPTFPTSHYIDTFITGLDSWHCCDEKTLASVAHYVTTGLGIVLTEHACLDIECVVETIRGAYLNFPNPPPWGFYILLKDALERYRCNLSRFKVLC